MREVRDSRRRQRTRLQMRLSGKTASQESAHTEQSGQEIEDKDVRLKRSHRDVPSTSLDPKRSVVNAGSRGLRLDARL